ncbi:hypothetical protein HAX54_048542 [Datura stramonium]|uniref:Uncharacterized protein n=1 Tax=Datura stramonium TaxID=4076 RepID=A0ABS8SUN8_DATST|nr:hypothetical protein [Datura stramonium]
MSFTSSKIFHLAQKFLEKTQSIRVLFLQFGSRRVLVEMKSSPFNFTFNVITRMIAEKKQLSPLLAPRLYFSAEECEVAGYRVPHGTVLLVNAWAMHNDPKEGGVALVSGENLAIHVLGLALGSLLQCFEWEKPNSGIIDFHNFTKDSAFMVKRSPQPNMIKLLSEL